MFVFVQVTRRQQSAETTIENLTHQLAELHESESLLNARKQHESIVASMQQRYNVELHTLKEKLDAATETVSEKVLVNSPPFFVKLLCVLMMHEDACVYAQCSMHMHRRFLNYLLLTELNEYFC